MKPLIILSIVLFMCSAVSWSQSGNNLLSEVSRTIHENHDAEAETIFRRMISDNTENAEMFYWVYLDKQLTIAPKLAHHLASHFEDAYDYDKAGLYYKEWIHYYPEQADRLIKLAKVNMLGGKEGEALNQYERILELEPNNLEAHIFIGNYYYLQGKVREQSIKKQYKRIQSPTRMQYAHYRNELNELFTRHFVKARNHFEEVLSLFSSVEARKRLSEIKRVEKEVFK